MTEELKLAESGLDLCEAFYREVGRPAIERRYAHYLPRMAVGLAGEGSECYGFDDRISMDHDYGPSFCVWVTFNDDLVFGEEIQRTIDALPAEFHGVKYRLRLEQARNRRGLDTIPNFYKRFLGPKGEPQTLTDWFLLSESHLAAATNGRVFEDDLGEFSRIRNKLLDFYPDDVWLHRMASRAITMAHEGQCNYSRMLRRGDAVAAYFALSQFLSAACSLLYLLNRRYAPYYKWLWRGLEGLETGGELAPRLKQMALAGPDLSHWPAEDWQKYAARLNLNDPNVAGIEEVCAFIARELRKRGLSQAEGDYLEPHARELQNQIQDDLIRRQPIKLR
ncbi:MAG: DUF4037 domain-containing protein [Firmicutes bacterium]|nr:DUF4037 domain-containing protein [Bacillota bacterium]